MVEKSIIFILFLIMTIISLSFSIDNLIKNGSFENSNGFTYESWCCSVLKGYEDAPDGGGKWSVQFHAGDIVPLSYQDVCPVNNGEIYKIECYAKVDIISVIDIERSLRNINDSIDSLHLHYCTGYGANYIPTDPLPNYYVWIKLTCFDTILCGPDIQQYRLYVSAYAKEDGAGLAYLDLVSMIKVGNAGNITITYSPENNSSILVNPNPFKQITSIVNTGLLFNTFHTGRIYSNMGELVKTIDFSQCSNVSWDGKCDNGNLLPSGLYILKINGASAKKITIVR